jgi:CRISPR/Cas system-associated protein Csx1
MAVASTDGSGKSIIKRWSAGRKKEIVLRLLKGEPVDELSREVGVPIAQIEKWKETVLTRMELLLKERSDDPWQAELEAAKKQIGELCMENELLRVKAEKKGVFWAGRW